MRETPNSTLPPPHVLEALRVPRADQVWALAAWSRAAADPWRRDWLLTPFEIAALRREAKENGAYFRRAFADLRPTAQEAMAEAQRVANLRPLWYTWPAPSGGR